MASRLPVPGQDDGQWGAILNDYLTQSLTFGGNIKPDIVDASQLRANAVSTSKIADGSVTRAKLETAVQSSLNKADSALQVVSKSTVGLANVDNTSDASKPLSAAATTALSTKANVTDVANVVYFGADATGAADATTAVQAAIDSLATTGGVVWFPVGAYTISGNLYLKKAGVSLSGARPLITMASGVSIVVGDTATAVTNRASINGLRFYRPSFVSGDMFISYVRSREMVVFGCTFENADKAICALANANVANHNNSSWVINRNQFVNVNYAWYVDVDASSPWGAASDSMFVNNIVNVAYVAGVYIKSIDGVTINGNVFFMINYASTNTKKSLKTNGIYVGRNGWSHIHDNNIFEAGTEGILLVDCSSAVNVTGNNVAWPGQRIASDGIKIMTISLAGYKPDIVCTGNVVDKYTLNAISYYGPIESLVHQPNSTAFDATSVTYFANPRPTSAVTSNTIPVDDATQYAIGSYVDLITLPSTVVASNRQVTARVTTNGAQTITIDGAAVTTVVSVSGSAGQVIMPTGVLPDLARLTHKRYWLDDTCGVAFALLCGPASNRDNEEDKLPSTTKTISQRVFGRFYAECTTNAILCSFGVGGSAAIVNLTDALRSVSGYTGTVIIEARRGLNSNDRSASYTVHIGKTSQGAECSLVGSPVGAVSGGNIADPSFTFSVNSTNNQLVATAVGSTAGSFYFYLHTSGNVIVK